MMDGRQTAWLMGTHLGLFFGIGELNTFLSSFGLYLSLDLLLLVFPGLFLPLYSGFSLALLLGFLSATAHPAPMGLTITGYILLWMLLGWSRTRVRTPNKWHLVATCCLLQVLWIAILTVGLLWEGLASLVLPPGLLLDALFSCLGLAGLVPLWCHLQKRLLLALGWNLEARPVRS
jgi:hypothetical protein